ncbi:MAG TPA: CAP domain-containing protein, partial [Acidimicrobiales bacterium]|nr:CAP domain-containing protein [Acidimicrobiales bacterium]
MTARPALAEATFETRALELVNVARAAAGVAPEQLSARVAAIAGDAPYDGCGFRVAGRAADMGARHYFSHAILNCGNQAVSHMLTAAGVANNGVAENIAWVSAMTDPLLAAERLHNDLMASPTHRANLLDPRFTHVGIGSWRSAPGADWNGAGTPLRNVFVTAQVFITAPAAGARYHPLTPSRILDTRIAGVPLGAGAAMDLQVAGAGGVPATGVSAVVL